MNVTRTVIALLPLIPLTLAACDGCGGSVEPMAPYEGDWLVQSMSPTTYPTLDSAASGDVDGPYAYVQRWLLVAEADAGPEAALIDYSEYTHEADTGCAWGYANNSPYADVEVLLTGDGAATGADPSPSPSDSSVSEFSLYIDGSLAYDCVAEGGALACSGPWGAITAERSTYVSEPYAPEGWDYCAE